MNEPTAGKGVFTNRSGLFWAGLAVGVIILFGCMLGLGTTLGIGVFAVSEAFRADRAVTAVAVGGPAARESVPEPRRAEPGPQAAPKVGNPAPDFTLKDLDGETISLSDYAGRPVLINFWATWCGPCEAEMPEIDAAYQAYRDEGFVVLAVDLQEHPDTVRSFIDYYGFEFPVLLDRNHDVGDRYLVRGLPTTYFVDPSGTVAHIYIGQMDAQDIEIGLRKILPDGAAQR